MSVLSKFARSFSVFKNESKKVAPEVQSKIDEIMAKADAEVKALHGSHSIQAIKDEADKDIKAVQDTAAHHVALIQAARDARIKDANSVLPPVVLPTPVATPVSA